MRVRSWVSRAKLAGPIELDVLNADTLQLELGKGASRVRQDGFYTGGAFVQLTGAEVEGLIEDLLAARAEMKNEEAAA